MVTVRIIPCLDVRFGRTVKGTNFRNLRDAGDPVELAMRYSDEGADELVFLDIAATLEARTTYFRLVERVAKAIQIPFTVGGGISSVDEAVRALDAGADKVSLNSAILADPDVLNAVSSRVGSQSIVAAVDVKRENGGWTVWSRAGTTRTGRDAMEWCSEVVRRGAGELLLTSMDRDGTGAGYDVQLLRAVNGRVRVPFIASGGAGTEDQIRSAILDGHADAVLAASIFHYGTVSIPKLKQYLRAEGIPVR